MTQLVRLVRLVLGEAEHGGQQSGALGEEEQGHQALRHLSSTGLPRSHSWQYLSTYVYVRSKYTFLLCWKYSFTSSFKQLLRL